MDDMLVALDKHHVVQNQHMLLYGQDLPFVSNQSLAQ